jgi:3-oxoacyl-[acyl-carrier protein] reductase
VNNAGITYNALFQMSNEEQIRRTMDVNFVAPYLFSQYIIKLMLRTGGGNVVNIASSAALDGNSGRSIYGASKASVVCATKAMAEELGSKNIRANSIAPGITQTDMLSSMTDEVIAETVNATDSKEAGTTTDIANACLFLASDLSSYITGQVLRVDGGM